MYLDQRTTQFESATVAATFVVLLGAAAAMVASGWWAAGTTGLIGGLALAGVGGLLWALALRGYRAGVRQTLAAVGLLVRGREAPPLSPALDETRRS